ncbi:MAG: PVC-type heme-binding CxxCH protein [Flavitalea sp.]
MQKIGWLFFLSVAAMSCSSDNKEIDKGMGSFQLEPGLRIELIAAEPLVIDPVAIAFDEKKTMYVVEDRGYPDPAEGGSQPTTLGRVALLKDTDGDGKYDSRTDFVTGLTYPNGVMAWHGGIFVTCAPDIYYFKDTTGDGVADIKMVALTGFNANKTAQIRVSTPVLGLDGWVYISGGLNSGDIISPGHPERPAVSFTSGDGRFNPETMEFQATGGVSQFGLAFDDFGRRFGCSNRHPLQHIVLEPWSLQRNKNLLFTETYQNVSASESNAKVFPVSGAITSADFIPTLIGRSHTGTFTSACGVIVYNGIGLSPQHMGNAFICEPAQNLIQRQTMHPQGVSFQSSLVYEGKDFLASTDESFRPVFLQSGPEGALYVVDMNRKVIDHPSYVPEEARSKLDFETGKTTGRIYRIVSKDFSGKPAEEKGLAGIGSPVEWERATAFRLAMEKRDVSASPELRNLALALPAAESRTMALWLLVAHHSLDAELLIKSLSDTSAGVREQAALLSGPLAEKNSSLKAALIANAADKDARVRFNTALTLGNIAGIEAVNALASIAAGNGDDRWTRAAVLSGIGDRLPQFLHAFRKINTASPAAVAAVMQDLGRLFGNGAALSDCKALLKETLLPGASFDWSMATALGLAEGLSGRKNIAHSSKCVLFSALNAGDQKAFELFLEKAADSAKDKNRPESVRQTAANLLGYANFSQAQPALGSLLSPGASPELQLSAIASFGRLGNPQGASIIIEKNNWSGYTPRVRSAVIATLASNPAFLEILFGAIQKGVISAAEISSIDRDRLIKDSDSSISKRASLVFKEVEGGARMKTYEEFKSILDKPGNKEAGKIVFTRVCSSCHSHGGQGGKVGPDLTGVSNQPEDALLLHILAPNYEVLPAYQAIAVKTSDNQMISGWLMAETGNSVTLKTAFGTEVSILRSNILSLVNSGLSLMPEGLEKTMSKDELRNLIAFLKSGH